MALSADEANDSELQTIFVRADEVDIGTSIPSTGSQKPLSALTPLNGDGSYTARPTPPPRPALRRDGTNPPPPPPSQPPPAPPEQPDPTNSLSLPQLKQLVNQFPKTEQRAYAYQYSDAENFATEIDEWFCYTELDQDREYLLSSRDAFEQLWTTFCKSEFSSDNAIWSDVTRSSQLKFVGTLIPCFNDQNTFVRQEALSAAYYLLSGVWRATAGLEVEAEDEEPSEKTGDSNGLQIQWMHNGVDVIVEGGALSALYQALQTSLEQPFEMARGRQDFDDSPVMILDEAGYREACICLSCIYIIVESSRSREEDVSGSNARRELMSLSPTLPVYLSSVIARLRWEESYNIPLAHAIQLFWKSILLTFGGLRNHLDKVKGFLQPNEDPFSTEAAHPILTASPLDYHLFRQEITSKYPSYNPPPPLIPLEIEQKSMLPPLPMQSKQDTSDGGSTFATVAGAPIMHQPVHIATPAPSPPPSPAGPGGKAGKKQNYQTNQNFPFLYPPLDGGSNNIGGKGSTRFQDTMVGRKWDGSDIPASIIEAGELFASRMRMTRGMRQLWKQRDLFTKYDRGWNPAPPRAKDQVKIEGYLEEDELQDADLRSRMAAVEGFFHDVLPDLQSLIIVMMKAMLGNVQDIAIRNGGFQDVQGSGLNRSKSNSNLAQNQALPTLPAPLRPNEITIDELNNIRSHEISQKAISGVILLMLKWTKISHILKFEYFTQLLLDSNYLQLTLKYFAHQNLEDLVAFSYDRDDCSFWHFCHVNSDHSPSIQNSPDDNHQSDGNDEEVDEALPPPIARHRPSTTTRSDSDMPTITITESPEQNAAGLPAQTLPSVDELGNPIGPLPSEPIKAFSARQFYTAINLLRVLQKMTRSKAHRVLLLVQFKSSQILRRVLRVPDPLLRLYVLKLFKSQVPYCGRKWRQSNMRVITAIYLHCRPELRDEWLAGMHDVHGAGEGEVDEAIPHEWAMRGLCWWWLKRNYADVMDIKQQKQASRAIEKGEGADSYIDEGAQEVEEEERDFFQRELDAMGWGLAALSLGSGEDVGFGEEAPGVMNGADGDHPWDSVPGQEAWS